MQITVLGSGTLLPSATRSSSAYHVDVAGASVLLDCGAGTLHGMARHDVAWSAITHLAVTHFHPDHVGDLTAFLFAVRNGMERTRTDPLTLLGPPGFETFLERLAAAMGAWVLDPGYPLHVREISQATPFEDRRFGLRIEACSTPHTQESVAYRLTEGTESLGYTGDTGPSKRVASFLEGCGLLLSECAWPDESPGDGHLTPRSVSKLARRVRPSLLVLTHVYPPMTPSEAERRVREMYEGRTRAAEDGMRIMSGAAGWVVDPSESAV
ncbi:MAG: ribonuclease Z [Gemmatimonadota bacterium]|nr:ribonuclease Z [Gemmatimonadota bacterium]